MYVYVYTPTSNQKKGFSQSGFQLVHSPNTHLSFFHFFTSVPEFLRMYSFDSICTSVAIESYYITNNIHVYSNTCVFTISISMKL